MAEQQMELPTSQAPAAPSVAQEPEAKKPRKKASKKASPPGGRGLNNTSKGLPMPILRLTKTDPTVAVVDVKLDMGLTFTGFDGISYTFDWTGRGGLLPLTAVDKAINPNNRATMLRSIWVLADAEESGSWVAEDVVTTLSSRLGSRSGHIISQLPMQQTTGVSAPSFSAMSLRDHSVEEVAAYFRQFDYGPIIEASASKPRMSPMVAPASAAALARFQQQLEEHPGIIGNDLT